MTATPSLRKMWTFYKHLLVEDGFDRRNQILAQAAFYSGARCVLIRRHGRTIRRLQGQTPRKRRH